MVVLSTLKPASAMKGGGLAREASDESRGCVVVCGLPVVVCWWSMWSIGIYIIICKG